MLAGHERHADLVYPDLQFRYYLLADRFGWTPNQVDEQPAWMIDWIVAIAGIAEEVKAEQASK